MKIYFSLLERGLFRSETIDLRETYKRGTGARWVATASSNSIGAWSSRSRGQGMQFDLAEEFT